MKVLCWNVREATSDEVLKQLKDSIRVHDPFMVFLLETRLPSLRIDGMKTALKFNSAYGTDAIDFSGEIWLLWDSARIRVDILPHDFQALHAIVQSYYHMLNQPPSTQCFLHSMGVIHLTH